MMYFVIVGGKGYNANQEIDYTDTLILDPITRNWSQGPALPNNVTSIS